MSYDITVTNFTANGSQLTTSQFTTQVGGRGRGRPGGEGSIGSESVFRGFGLSLRVGVHTVAVGRLQACRPEAG